MARKSRFTAEVKANAKVATFLAGVYARLSIEDEDDMEQNSIGNQKKIALDFLKDKDDVAVVDYYVDNGYTGMNYKRPDFQRMMDDLRSGKINCVIVKDVSRLGRHFVMTSEIVEKIFPMMDVRFICINDDYDSIDEHCDSAALLLPFKMVMNDSYVKDISNKIRSSITSKMNSGEYLPSASSIPYGYIRNEEENTYDIDEEAAEVVIRIFEMRANGMGQTAIAKVLNEEGIPSPGKLRYIRGITKAAKYKDALWIHGTIRKMLQDQVYIGNRVHGKVKRDKVGMDKIRRSEDEWQIIENTHKPIVSRELFDIVQKVMCEAVEKRKGYKQQEAPESDNRDVLRGKVYCGDCGNLMRAGKALSRADENGNRKARIYYDCGKYLDSGRLVCVTHYVRESDIVSSLQNTLDNQLRIAVDLERFLEEVKNMPKVVVYQSNVNNQLMSIRTKRRNMESRLENLLVDLTDGLLDKQEYAYAKQRYNAEYERLVEEETKMLGATKEFSGIIFGADQWLRFMREYQRFPAINRQVVEYMVKQIKVYPDKRFRIELNYQDPFKRITEYVNNIPEVIQNAG